MVKNVSALGPQGNSTHDRRILSSKFFLLKIIFNNEPVGIFIGISPILLCSTGYFKTAIFVRINNIFTVILAEISQVQLVILYPFAGGHVELHY